MIPDYNNAEEADCTRVTSGAVSSYWTNPYGDGWICANGVGSLTKNLYVSCSLSFAAGASTLWSNPNYAGYGGGNGH